jgi:probable selenium-dependent hydroxylase accessory protein YqeC
MWHIQKTDPARNVFDAKYITFVGAGGKSSLIEYLAGQADRRNKKTAIITTTKIYMQAPYMLFKEYASGKTPPVNPIRIGKTLENGKLTALDFDDILELGKTFDTVLIEADGAKGKPLKYPARHEPVIPPFSEMVFVIAGLDSLFGHIDDKVFRWELLKNKKGLAGNEVISPELFKHFFAEEILLKDIEQKPCTIVLNKYDTLIQREAPFEIAKSIIKKTGVEKVIVSSLTFQVFYEIKQLSL